MRSSIILSSRRSSRRSPPTSRDDAEPGRGDGEHLVPDDDEQLRLALVASLEASRHEDRARGRAEPVTSPQPTPAPVAAPVTSCEICCEDFDAQMRAEIGSRRVTGSCNHGRAVCWACINKHVTTEMGGKGNVEEISCPHNECNCHLQYEDVRYFTKQDEFERYDNLKLRRALQGMHEFRWCAHTGCGSGQLTDGGEAAMSFMRCCDCHRLTCLRHRCPMHAGMSCDEYEQEAERSDEVALHQYLQSDAVRRCIGCGQGIEKKEGCDHMTCRKNVGGCGAEFCWRCGADYNGRRGIRARGNSAHKTTCQWYFPDPREEEGASSTDEDDE